MEWTRSNKKGLKQWYLVNNYMKESELMTVCSLVQQINELRKAMCSICDAPITEEFIWMCIEECCVEERVIVC